MDEIKKLAEKIFNLTEDKLADYIESDGTINIDGLIELDAQRIKALKEAHKSDLTRMHDEGYNKGKGESLTKYEARLKEELGVQTDAKGIDLIKELIAKNSKNEIDEEKIKLHPRYIELEKKLNNEFIPRNEYEKVKAEFDQYKDQIEKANTYSAVKQDAVKVFRSLKPVLSKDPVKATNQELDFVNKLIQYEYEVQSDGNHIIKQGGKRLETANGYPVSFADFVKSEAMKFFDFEVQDPKGNAGNNNSGGGLNVVLPKSEKEYLTMLATEPDPAKAVALMKAWEQMNK